MYRALSAVRHLAAIAAAVAVTAACSGNDVRSAESTNASLAGIPARTPLVDDHGWPMPADPVPAGSVYLGAQKGATR